MTSSHSVLGKLAATAAAACSTAVLIFAVADPDHNAGGRRSPHVCVYRHALAQADPTPGVGPAQI